MTGIKTGGIFRAVENLMHGSGFFMLEDLMFRIYRVNKTMDQWDLRIAEAGAHDRAEAAGRLLDAARRDNVRWEIWQDPKTNRMANFGHAEDALEYMSDRLHEIASDIAEEWRPCPCRNMSTDDFTRSDETKWKLREISDALSILINGVAK